MAEASGKVLMIIPSIDGGALLRRMLPTLGFSPSHTVVLDQGSGDDTASVCAAAGVELIQLGRPHTYTEACNIGARMARDRGAEYVCVANNDIVFKTDVIGALLNEMERDSRLGIVSPSQIIVDATLGRQPLSYRVHWNLDTVDFHHETDVPAFEAERLEADFCELTCALVRLSAIDEIGFLDDAYGFYHEDADFGFRLREAGYSCAYLPQAQIEHFSSSTFNKNKLAVKAEYIARNKRYFAEKHLGYGVSLARTKARHPDEWESFGTSLQPYLKRYGLISSTRPELVLASHGVECEGFIYTAHEGPTLPVAWHKWHDRYQGIFATSTETCQQLADAGYANVRYVPVGIEPDTFNPWGGSHRLFDERTYLALIDRGQAQATNMILSAWYRFASDKRDVRLLLVGPGLLDSLGRAPDSSYRWGDFEIADFDLERITVREVASWPDDAALATLYRSVDFTICASAGDGRLAAVLESSACGTPCIYADSGSAADFRFDGSLAFQTSMNPQGPLRDLAEHEYLLQTLERSYGLDDEARRDVVSLGLARIRNGFTLRDTSMKLRQALTGMQTPDATATVEALKRRQATSSAIATPSANGTTTVARLSMLTARRVNTVGRLTQQFGSIWEGKGFKVASRETLSELSRAFSMGRHRLAEMRARASDKLSRSRGKIRLSGPSVPRAPKGSTLLIGYIDAQLGLGQSLRGLALALSKTDRPFAIYPFTLGVESRRGSPYMAERYQTTRRHDVTVIEVTPDELPRVFGSLDGGLFDGSYTILRTYWELAQAPESWRAKLERIDEIWAPNEFVAESFRPIFEGPVNVVPPCVIPLEVDASLERNSAREKFDLDRDRFYFLFSFDYYSFLQRKNPLAVVRAFQQAFGGSGANVGLVVKSTGSAEHHPEIKRQLLRIAGNDERVTVIDSSLSREEMVALMNSVDCYVSLHRAEGFGLGMAEAMTLGKPVIGTDYSGNTEFLKVETGYPVKYRLKRLSPNDYIYTEGQVWAEPDEADCAAAMVQVFNDRETASRRAAAGKAFIDARFGVENVARLVDIRLGEILSDRQGSE